jgi:hypothetical protein
MYRPVRPERDAITPVTAQRRRAAPDGLNAVAVAQALGSEAISLAGEEDGKPAGHLKEVVRDLSDGPFKARVVRSGVAEVTMRGEKACLTLPASTRGTPKVVKGGC